MGFRVQYLSVLLSVFILMIISACTTTDDGTSSSTCTAGQTWSEELDQCVDDVAEPADADGSGVDLLPCYSCRFVGLGMRS